MSTTQKLVRIKELVKMVSLGRSTIWLKVKNGEFPQPIKLSARVTAWKLSDIEAWIHECEQAQSEVGA